MEHTHKRSLVSKIAWGTLIAGAGIAIATVVGFVVAPEATRTIIDKIAGQFFTNQSEATQFVDKILGHFNVAPINDAAKNIADFGDKAAAAKAEVIMAESDRTLAGRFAHNTWIGRHTLLSQNFASIFDGSAFNTAADKLAANTTSLDAAKTSLDQATRAAAAGSTGIIKFIINNRIVSGIGAALAMFGLMSVADNSKEKEAEDYAAAQREAKESQVMQLDMRKMQTVMALRAAAAGHPGAQQFLAQQNGRG